MRIKTKLVICVTVLMAILFGIGGSLMITITFNSYLDSEKNTALQSFRMIRSTLTIANSISRQTGYDDIIDVLSQLSTDGKTVFAALLLYDDKNEIIFKSSSIALNSDISEDNVHDMYSYVKFITVNGYSYFKIYEPINVNGTQLILMALYDTTQIYSLRENQNEIYRRVLVIISLASAIGAWVTAALVTRSVKALSKVTNEIANGSLSTRAEIHSGDEVERLADDFNNMAERLESTISELTGTLAKQEEFMGSFAHELKTPMTSIIGYADLIRGQALDDEERTEAAQYIFSEAKRLESLSFKLLDLIMLNREKLTLKKTLLTEIVREAAETFKARCEKSQIDLVCNCCDVYADVEEDLFKSLVINLLDNAYKSIEARGRIDVCLKFEDSKAVLKVSDTGMGIPQKEMDKITEAFYRVDKSRSSSQGGVGLGLALCSEIVKLHKGTMVFESKLGEGTTVSVILGGEADV